MRALQITALTFAFAACTAPSYPQSWPAQSLVLTGDALGENATVTGTGDFAVNNGNDWRVAAMTSVGGQIVLGPGGVVASSGAVLNQPAGASWLDFTSIGLDIEGNFAALSNLAGTSSAGDAGYFVNGKLVLQESDFLPVPGPQANLAWLEIKAAHFADNGLIMVTGAISSGITPGLSLPALVQVQIDPSGQLLAVNVVAKPGDMIAPGLLVESVASSLRGFYVTDTGHMIYGVDTDAPSASDGLVIFDGQVVAREGMSAPVAGRLWKDLSEAAVTIDHILNWAVLGRLDGDSASDQLIAYNDVKWRQTGDAVPGLGQFQITDFGGGGIELDNTGSLLWFGRWNGSDAAKSAGLFVDDHMIVQTGVTMVAGKVITKLFDEPGRYVLSEGGTQVLFEAELANDKRGVFMATKPIASTAQYFGCAPTGGQMLLLAGTPSIGTLLHLRFFNPQSKPALTYIAVSPNLGTDLNGCGQALPGVGEVLIDAADPGLVLLPVGTFAGAVLNTFLTIPNDPALLGKSLFAQALFIDPTNQNEPFRATNALSFTFGL